MRITFLGTAAANAFPEAFCLCSHCVQARQAGGRSLRKRSSLLINDDLLIDLGPDIMAAAQMHNVSLTNVCYCLQTHPHADHLDLSHLLSRSPGFGVVGAPRLHLYASPDTLQRADRTFRQDLSGFGLLDSGAGDELNLQIHAVQPLAPFTFGSYRAIAFPANHAPGMGAYLYSVAHQDVCIFYGTDTAELPTETWQAFQDYQLKFDLVILDHTYGPEEEASDHLSAWKVAEHARRLREIGLLKENGQVFATHIAHEGNPIHEELGKFAVQHGYEVAYDGLVINR